MPLECRAINPQDRGLNSDLKVGTVVQKFAISKKGKGGTTLGEMLYRHPIRFERDDLRIVSRGHLASHAIKCRHKIVKMFVGKDRDIKTSIVIPRLRCDQETTGDSRLIVDHQQGCFEFSTELLGLNTDRHILSAMAKNFHAER